MIGPAKAWRAWHHSREILGSRCLRAGFTLIEIVVTLVILSMLVAIALPAFLRDGTPPDMDMAQGRLEALFTLVRDSAVRIATPVTLTIDSVSEHVWIEARTRLDGEQPLVPENDLTSLGSSRPTAGGTLGGGSTLGATLGMAGGAFREVAGDSIGLPPSVHMELYRARAQFTFSPSGAVVGDSILLRSSTGQTRLVTVDPWSGHALAR